MNRLDKEPTLFDSASDTFEQLSSGDQEMIDYLASQLKRGFAEKSNRARIGQGSALELIASLGLLLNGKNTPRPQR